VRHIILVEQEARDVEWISTPGHALHPLPLRDGAYVLPEEVLGDKAHMKHLSVLGQKTRREVDPIELPHLDSVLNQETIPTKEIR
jgi:hypothetical protein